MIRLHNIIKAWGTTEFNDVLKTEIEAMDATTLPLQQGLTISSHALDNNIQAMILNVSDNQNFIHVKAGIFYTGIIAGCNCADDPSPVEENNEYCEVQIVINKTTSESTIQLATS
jgi:hypothetical protein